MLCGCWVDGGSLLSLPWAEADASRVRVCPDGQRAAVLFPCSAQLTAPTQSGTGKPPGRRGSLLALGSPAGTLCGSPSR